MSVGATWRAPLTRLPAEAFIFFVRTGLVGTRAINRHAVGDADTGRTLSPFGPIVGWYPAGPGLRDRSDTSTYLNLPVTITLGPNYI